MDERIPTVIKPFQVVGDLLPLLCAARFELLKKSLVHHATPFSKSGIVTI